MLKWLQWAFLQLTRSSKPHHREFYFQEPNQKDLHEEGVGNGLRGYLHRQGGHIKKGCSIATAAYLNKKI